MMPVPAMLGASQLVHKPPEAKLLAIHSAHQQPQATPQHNYQQPNHMLQQHQQQQQQQSKPGSFLLFREINQKRQEKWNGFTLVIVRKMGKWGSGKLKMQISPPQRKKKNEIYDKTK